jgi:hypothetical protein
VGGGGGGGRLDTLLKEHSVEGGETGRVFSIMGTPGKMAGRRTLAGGDVVGVWVVQGEA